ncbi:hypothetical protein, partial [Mycoplasmopsis meleagridis]
MKKKYLFSLPIVSSLATLPFFISQSNTTTQTSSNQNNTSLSKIKDDIVKSTNYYSALSLNTMNNISVILSKIQNQYKINMALIGLEYLYGNFQKLSKLNSEFKSYNNSNDYSKLIANNSDFISFQSDLASEYFALQHLDDLLTKDDENLRSYLLSQASNIYASAKNKFNLSFHNGANNFAPPIKSIANAYDEATVKYLGDELTKAKKINEENQTKSSKDSSTQTEEITSSTESTPVTNNPTGEVKTEQLSEENKIKALLIASTNYIKNNMIQTVDKITKELKAINEATNISLLKIGTVSTGFLFDACNELVKEADEAIKKRDYRTAVSKTLQLNEFTTSLAAEYYSAKQINDTLKLAKGEIRTKLIEKADSIYDTVKNDYKISSHSEYEVEPPIQLL